MRRALAVAAATIVGVAGLAAPSGAAVLPVCGEGVGSGNIPGETCEVTVDAEAFCDADDDVALEYAVEDEGGAATVDITFTGLPGGNRTVADQPLEGSLPWPTGVTRDLTVVFAATESVSVPVDFPDECREGAVLASRSSERGVLAATGLTAAPLAIGGGALIAGGAALVLLRRRQHNA